MNKRILIFSLLSLAYLFVFPVTYFFPGFVFLRILVPLSVIALVSFLRINILIATQHPLSTFIKWFVSNTLFNVLYIVVYIINLGILRQRYGWYSDMAGAELFIIVPLLLAFNILSLITIFIARSKIIRGHVFDDKNDRKWIASAIILGIVILVLFLIGSNMAIFA